MTTQIADKHFAFGDSTQHVTLSFGDTKSLVHAFAEEPGNGDVGPCATRARVTADLLFHFRHYHDSTALETQCAFAVLKVSRVFVDKPRYTEDKLKDKDAHLGHWLFGATSRSSPPSPSPILYASP